MRKGWIDGGLVAKAHHTMAAAMREMALTGGQRGGVQGGSSTHLIVLKRPALLSYVSPTVTAPPKTSIY